MANFLSKVKSNLYTNKNFYKIISYSNNKLIHSGLNKIDDYSRINKEYIDDFDTIPLEIKQVNKETIYETPIVNPREIKKISNKFEKGSLSMVKVNRNKSSSTEFFFTLNNSPELDGRYSIFGKVIGGLEILNNIDKNDFIKKIEI